MPRAYPETIKQTVVELYESGLLIREIAERLGVSLAYVNNVVKACVATKRGVRRQYRCNVSYFCEIDSAEKAYWLGFILADGSVSKDGSRLAINLSAKDEQHLRKFQKCIGSNHLIYNSLKNIRSLVIGSVELCASLQSRGIVSRAKQPFLEHRFPVDYWRGFVDGDGSLRDRKVIRGSGKEHFTSALGVVGEPIVVQAFEEFCKSNVMTTAKRNDFGAYSRFRIHGPMALQMCEVLYGNATMCLDRKRKRYDLMMLNRAKMER
jgi:hypothetical protein